MWSPLYSSSRGMCPHCRSVIEGRAKVCPRCTRDMTPVRLFSSRRIALFGIGGFVILLYAIGHEAQPAASSTAQSAPQRSDTARDGGRAVAAALQFSLNDVHVIVEPQDVIGGKRKVVTCGRRTGHARPSPDACICSPKDLTEARSIGMPCR